MLTICFRLLGGYDRLENVRLEDALQDLTGCVLDTLPFTFLTSANDLRRVQMFETLQQSLIDSALILLCTKVLPVIKTFIESLLLAYYCCVF